MLGLKIRLNGEVLSVMGAENAESLQVTVIARRTSDNSAVLVTHGYIAETPQHRTDRSWVEPRNLLIGDAVSVELVEVASADPGRITGEHGRKVTAERAELFCSWCGKSEHAVKKLVAGPNMCICDECANLVSEIISAT